jgi:hypothetical protein
MNLNQGKVAFDSKPEAEKAAQRMHRKYDEAFRVYKLGSDKWAVGGVFIKKRPPKKVRSLLDIKTLYADYKESEADTSVEEYVADIHSTEASTGQVGTSHGADAIWTLVGHSIKSNEDLGIKKIGQYLVLEITNGEETVTPKMGGAFSRHIPLMSRIAASLIDKPVLWASWNPKNEPDKWGKNSWFYQLELNEELTSDG